MEKESIKPFALWPETIAELSTDGLLLCTGDAAGRCNAMTIGWMTGGEIWFRPIITVLVRPSRHSFGLIEEVPEFTVNVLPRDLAGSMQVFGNRSGRDLDKFAQSRIKPGPARKVKAPLIEQSVIHYECRVVHKNDVIPENLGKEIIAEAYPKGDFHRMYYGEIVGAYALPDARERLVKAAPAD